eukprot:CAMPEP_0176454380 /NCGR_PEP_ID=MMETSP0127-20121128/29928_1 /TAXON_ID=938130 /ORGANISM="Platyophrya macrostoma, Strain WH" /LENGTH=66 /DNA_ID=CAMNT_0017843677 /DNA_START=537 /DNA_END=733 /DNA_ORIENTATION=+
MVDEDVDADPPRSTDAVLLASDWGIDGKPRTPSGATSSGTDWHTTQFGPECTCDNRGYAETCLAST